MCKVIEFPWERIDYSCLFDDKPRDWLAPVIPIRPNQVPQAEKRSDISLRRVTDIMTDMLTRKQGE